MPAVSPHLAPTTAFRTDEKGVEEEEEEEEKREGSGST